MKRLIPAVFAVLAFALVLLSQPGASTARVTPLPTSAALSPLAAPDVRKHDDFYRANPTKIKPRAVPFLDDNGDTIIEETVIEIPNHEPLILRVKAAAPSQPIAPAAEIVQVPPTTFQSPIGYGSYIYMPVISKFRDAPKHALVLVYMGESQSPGLPPPREMSFQLADDLYMGSTWLGNQGGVHTFDLGLVGNGVVTVYSYPPVQANGYFNVAAIYAEHNICARALAGEVDEVWIWADGKIGGNIYSDGEYSANGPTYAVLTPGIQNVPNCGKQLFTLYFNFDRVEAEALESWTHSLEHTIRWFTTGGYEICDADPPDQGLDQHCTGDHAYSHLYAFLAQPRAENTYIGVCGSVHWPPNRPVGSPGYIWNDPAYYSSRCEDWDWGDSGGLVYLNGETWGQMLNCQYTDTNCYQRAFLIWWMQHIPSVGNTAQGRTGAFRPNWLAFRLQP